MIEASQLRPTDRQNSAEPYMLATLSGPDQQKQGDRAEHKRRTLNPEFREMFEFVVQLP